MEKINIAVVDDHPMILTGLENTFRKYDDILLTATYSNATELMSGLAKEQPEIILLDIQMPEKNGDEIIIELHNKYPDLKIIIFTNFDSSLYLYNTAKEGVQGYILKTTSEKVLIEAIRCVYKGEKYIEQPLKEKLDDFLAKTKRAYSAKSNLSPREKEVLQLIADGNTDPEISKILFLSLSTVKHYRISILLKLDCKNTASLVRKALQLGLVD